MFMTHGNHENGGTMKKIFSIIIALLAPIAAFGALIDGPSFIGTDGKGLRVIAVSMPYLLTLGSGDIEKVFSALKGQGVTAAMINASYCGDSDYTFQKAPGVYNEKQFEKLDAAVDSASRSGIKLIVALADNSPEFGGKEVYSRWNGGSNDDIFFKDAISRDCYKKYIDHAVSRKNTVTGLRYLEDPAIMAWDLCSGADDASDADGTVLYSWADEMSAYLKSIDGLHPVMLDVNSGANSAEIFKLPAIDIAYMKVSAVQADGSGVTLTALSSGSAGLYSAVNKPVAASFTYTGKRENTPVLEAAKEFFGSKGSLLIYDRAGYGKYSGVEGAMDLLSEPLSIELIKAIEYAGSLKEKFESININGITAEVSTDSAVISAIIDDMSDIKVVYGEKEPLLLSVELKGAKPGKNTLKLEGLKPDMRYYYNVMASNSSKSGISKVMSLNTNPVKRNLASAFAMSRNFISAKGTEFYDGDSTYRYVGTNNYYIRSYYISKQSGAKNREKIDSIFAEAAKAGFKVIRVGSNGEALNESLINKDDPTHDFRIGPDKFNETAYKALDYVIDSAKRHNIRVILHFTDNWDYYGGVPVYAKWAGVQKNDFWVNDTCKILYKQTVDAFVKRRNTVSGVMYKDDPAIFAYDLMNEPRNENDQTSKQMNDWVAEMSSYVKSQDPNHMVTTGMEGFFLKEDGTHYSGTDFIGSQKPVSIDFCTFHIYPANTYNHFSASTTKWIIENYVKQAHETVKKPVVMEEYGIPNSQEDYPKPQWIDAMTGEFFAAGGNGANYWMLIDPSYVFGDGNEVSYANPVYMNIFVKYADEINKAVY
jgi:mannan endo-1,4-beta-mannosidase